jgi:SpoIIAA-like
MIEARNACGWTVDDRILRVTSTAERDSIIEAIRAAREDPGFEPGMALLIDARALEHAPQQLSSPLVRGRAFEIAAFGFRRCAVVAAATTAQIRLANLFATYADKAGVDARVFRKLEDAETWLQIPWKGATIILP